MLVPKAYPTPPPHRNGRDTYLEVPFHMRYLPPHSKKDYLPATTPDVRAFLVPRTSAAIPSAIVAKNPFSPPSDAVVIGVDLIGPDAVSLAKALRIPVGHLEDAATVEWMTLAVVILGVALVMWELARFTARNAIRDTPTLKAKKKI
ncbi:hypothetical protein HKX48_008841 [Thoreauomyces humboldtii]|nr:hypothetical protein HKX48_008841 [Thoreauomyces humboldtii]